MFYKFSGCTLAKQVLAIVKWNENGNFLLQREKSFKDDLILKLIMEQRKSRKGTGQTSWIETLKHKRKGKRREEKRK